MCVFRYIYLILQFKSLFLKSEKNKKKWCTIAQYLTRSRKFDLSFTQSIHPQTLHRICMTKAILSVYVVNTAILCQHICDSCLLEEILILLLVVVKLCGELRLVRNLCTTQTSKKPAPFDVNRIIIALGF